MWHLQPSTSSALTLSSRRFWTAIASMPRGDERGWRSYRGHVYRVLNLARAVIPDRSRLPRDRVRAVRESIDGGVFFTRTVPRALVRHLIRHPLDPLPIVRARRALGAAGYGHADH